MHGVPSLSLCGWLLPASIASLKSLKDLKLDKCGSLVILPAQMGALQALERLSLSGCWKLKQLPDGLADIPSLTELDVRQNELRDDHMAKLNEALIANKSSYESDQIETEKLIEIKNV